MRVVGLDLSLTSTGVATIEASPIPGDDWHAEVRTVTSKGRKDATLGQRQARLHNLRLDVCLIAGGADLVVIEGPSFGQARQGGQHDRAGVWWLVVDWLINNDPTEGWDTRVVEVPPSSRAKYATGKGNASKDHVLASVVRRYRNIETTGHDTADALILAAMGARALGRPIEDSLPQANLDAMAKVAWPDLIPVEELAQ